MAYPPAYTRAYSFTDWETLHPGEPKPGPPLDAEYDAVSNALTATQTNLALIQRADGALANDSVGEDQLQDGVFDGIADGITADAEAAAAAAQASANAAATSASQASASAASALVSEGNAAGAAAQAGVSQGIAQSSGADAAAMADDAADSAAAAANSANEAQGFRNEAGIHEETAFDWAELLTGPVMPAPPGWPEAVDDGMFSSKWWAIRARDYNATQTIDLGTAGADIGEAFDIWDAIPGNDLGVGQTYATWGTPTQTYVLIDRSNPSDPDSWQNITGGPGPPGPPNSLTIGTVTTGAPGSAALADITGTAPNQVLSLTIPAGATGGVGPAGPAGPPNALAIGTVTTVPDGTPSAATITGTAPTQTLNLTLTAGPQGIQGIQGIQGPVGPAVNLADPTGLIGLVAVPGVATTAPRSDATHALSQAIAPTWTGPHTFASVLGVPSYAVNNTTIGAGISGGKIKLVASGAAANGKTVEVATSPTLFLLRNVDDADSDTRNFLAATRAGLAVTNLAFGNATDNPSYTFLGTGLANFGGAATFGGTVTATGVVYAAQGGITSKLQSYGPGLTGLVGTESNHDFSIFTNNVPRTVYSANGATINNTPVLRGPDGSVGAPSYSFSGDTDTGYYLAGPNAVEAVAGGNRIMQWNSAAVVPIVPVLSNITGSAAAPAYSWTMDPGTGMYRFGGAEIGFACAGVNVLILDPGVIRTQVPFQIPDGTEAAPGLQFTFNAGLGFYRWGSDAFAATSGGNAVMSWRLGQTRINDGTAALPSLTFENDTNSGFYRLSSDYFGLTLGGVHALGFVHAGVMPQIGFNDGAVGTPSITFDADRDTGIYRIGPNQLGITAGGVVAMLADTTGVTAPSFNVASSRAIKRETGAPARARDILSRLRPILYRLLTGNDNEQLGLIAEEVHEVCPQLSDGKTVSYDRLAILLLAAWQDDHMAEAA